MNGRSQLVPMTAIRHKDIQIHAAVTVLPQKNNIVEIGKQPLEIAQFCVQFDAKFSPYTRKQFEIAFHGLMIKCLDAARAHGILRAGE